MKKIFINIYLIIILNTFYIIRYITIKMATFKFTSLDDITNIMEESIPCFSDFSRYLRNQGCLIQGDRDMNSRFADMCNRTTIDKSEAVKAMKIEKDKEEKYNRLTHFKIVSKEEQAKIQHDLYMSRINDKAMRYLSIFIKYVREIPFIFTEEEMKLDPTDKNCAPFYEINLENGEYDYNNIAYVVSSDIFNEKVWEYIIKNNLNNTTILELCTLLTTKIDMPPYMKTRIDKDGQQRFIKDVQTFNPAMYDVVVNMFDCINKNKSFLEYMDRNKDEFK